MVQEKTSELLESCPDMDERILEYILKQDDLSANEIEIWNYLLKWGQSKVAQDGSKTLRSVLEELLRFVRLETLSHKDIVTHIAPSQVLSGDELSSLLCAVIGEQPSSFRPTQHKRKLKRLAPLPSSINVFILLKSNHPDDEYYFQSLENKSTFTIQAKKSFKLLRFGILNRKGFDKEDFYNMKLSIAVRKYNDQSYSPHWSLEISKNDIFTRIFKNIKFNLRCPDKGFLQLEANCLYHFTLGFDPPHPTFRVKYFDGSNWIDNTLTERHVPDVMIVRHFNPFNLQGIQYAMMP